MLEENSVMKNIIGDRNGQAMLKGAGEVLSMEKTFLHVYGKDETKTGRKMGHITVLGNNLENTIDTANRARQNIFI